MKKLKCLSFKQKPPEKAAFAVFCVFKAKKWPRWPRWPGIKKPCLATKNLMFTRVYDEMAKVAKHFATFYYICEMNVKEK
jgi:hypothetical protein